VVDGDGVDDLGEGGRVERLSPRLDQTDPELDVAEEPALVGGPEVRRRAELVCSAGIVEERRCEEQICA
jgi:hypothetical protein